MSSYTLLIVESPAKCAKIESYLGEQYKCISSYGHLRELSGLDSIDMNNNFKPTFKECKDKLKQIDKIRSMIRNAKEVLLASDDDREGEAISWHICDLFKLPITKTKRIVFNEITETAIKKAVLNPILLNMNIVHAQMARQILDLLVGYKLSPILWKNIARNSKNGLSAGRCQTPALRIIYDNYKEIKNSPGVKCYNTTGMFTSKNIQFSLNYDHTNESNITAFLESSVNHKHIYDYSNERDVIKKAPLPFTTSSLQQQASNELNTSPKETMQLCQKLYEGGHITYMRTDSMTYSINFVEKVSNYILKEYGKNYIHESINDLTLDSKNATKETTKETTKKAKLNNSSENLKPNAQEAHEAIRPTNINLVEVPSDKYSSKEIRMYKLIRNNALESCMTSASYKSITCTITAPEINMDSDTNINNINNINNISGDGDDGDDGDGDNDDVGNIKNKNKKPVYKYICEQIVFPGWKIVRGFEKENNNNYTFLKNLKKGHIIEYKKLFAKVGIKGIKTHYTESKLVQLLEKKGIGRPSTFASLIDKIQERGYVKKDNVEGIKMICVDYELVDDELTEIEVKREIGNEKNKLIIQPVGILVIEFLLEKFGNLFEYSYTKNMEDQLDMVAKGNKVWHEICQECMNVIRTLANEMGTNEMGANEMGATEMGANEMGANEMGANEMGAKGANEIKDHTLPSSAISIKIDNEHDYIIAKYGPVIKCSRNGKVTFKKVKQNIDIDKLKKGEYLLSDILDETNMNFNGRAIGKYKEHEIILKNGKFGLYIEWGELTKSIKEYVDESKNINNISLEDIIQIINTDLNKNNEEPILKPTSLILRKITDDITIRTGKFGDYIFYKKKTMKQPKFIKLNGFSDDYKTCNVDVLKKWIKETHNIKM